LKSTNNQIIELREKLFEKDDEKAQIMHKMKQETREREIKTSEYERLSSEYQKKTIETNHLIQQNLELKKY
jgi:hypothetical protein